jgi:hypothetical protein
MTRMNNVADSAVPLNITQKDFATAMRLTQSAAQSPVPPVNMQQAIASLPGQPETWPEQKNSMDSMTPS